MTVATTGLVAAEAREAGMVRVGVLTKKQARGRSYCARQAAIASKYAVGSCAITIKIAATVGLLRFCSQPSSVRGRAMREERPAINFERVGLKKQPAPKLPVWRPTLIVAVHKGLSPPEGRYRWIVKGSTINDRRSENDIGERRQ
jgi:hypothetical protein